MKKSFVKRYFLNRYALIALGVVVIGAGSYLFKSSGGPEKLEYAVVTRGSVVEKVSVTGKILPEEKADLAFEKSGVVTSVRVKVGDVISKGDVLAALDDAGDAANLASAEAKLAELTRNLRPEELVYEESKVEAAAIALDNAKREALNGARTGYSDIVSAINDHVDTLFNNPQSINPTIKIRTRSQAEADSINLEKVVVKELFVSWKAEIDASQSSEAALSLIMKAEEHAKSIKSFVSDLSSIVGNLTPLNSGLAQTEVDAYVAAVNSALSDVNLSIAAITSDLSQLHNAQAAYDQAFNNFSLKNAGSSAELIVAERAAVKALRAALEKGRLVSPIDGVVTKVVPERGEFVSPGQVVIGVMSDGDYKVEAYVPEADIAKIAPGNMASTTLDAYGQDADFPAIVASIDPAETVFEGVPTYKVTLKFMNADDRIRSGMTANLEILTRRIDDVLTIPARAVVDTDEGKSVRVLDLDGKSYATIPVAVGFKGSEGKVSVISGLTEGQKVVTYIKEK